MGETKGRKVLSRKIRLLWPVKFDAFIRYPSRHIKLTVEWSGLVFWAEVFLSDGIG